MRLRGSVRPLGDPSALLLSASVHPPLPLHSDWSLPDCHSPLRLTVRARRASGHCRRWRRSGARSAAATLAANGNWQQPALSSPSGATATVTVTVPDRRALPVPAILSAVSWRCECVAVPCGRRTDNNLADRSAVSACLASLGAAQSQLSARSDKRKTNRTRASEARRAQQQQHTSRTHKGMRIFI